jgi:hypothetical protein
MKISPKFNYRKPRQSAMTLIEVMVTTTVATMLFMAIGSATMFTGRSMAGMANYSDLAAQSRQTLNLVTKEVRQARDVLSFACNDITLLDADNLPLRYFYDQASGTFNRVKSGATQVLLRDCQYFNFSIYQRNTVPGTYTQYAASGINTSKLIELNWKCSRSIMGIQINSEDVQSAKVVIRKK